MLVEMVRIFFNRDGSYNVSTILINPKHIVYLAEDRKANKLMSEGRIGEGFHKDIMFTKVKLSDAGLISEMTVIGSPESLNSKIFKQRKNLLRG
jgi:hypothetical protein